MAYASLSSSPITTEIALAALKDILPINSPKQVTIDMIQLEVSDYFNLPLSDFKAKKRTQAVAFPRQIAMYLCRKLTDFSLPKIGEEFGGRDHTTVIHANEKISNDLKKDPLLEKRINDIIQRIQSQ